MTKKLLSFLIVILMFTIASAFSFTDVLKEHGNPIMIFNGNISSYSHIYTLLSPQSTYPNIVLAGNLDNNLSDIEILIGSDNNQFKIFSSSLALKYTVMTTGNFKNYVLYDIENDGIYEIVNSRDYSFDIFYLWKNLTVNNTHSFKYKIPVCKAGYCYFQNQFNDIFRYDISNNIYINITIGNQSTSPSMVNLYVQSPLISENCSDLGESLIIFGDYDNTDYLNDIAIIPLNDFNIENTHIYHLPYTFSIVNSITCDIVNDQKYIGITTNGQNNNELWDDLYIKINSSNKAETIRLFSGASYADSMSIPIFYDINNDTHKDYCTVYNFWGWQANPNVYNTTTMCWNIYNDSLIYKTVFIPISFQLQLDRAQIFASLNTGDFLSDNSDNFMFGTKIINKTNGEYIKESGVQKLDTYNFVVLNQENNCTSLYYSSKSVYQSRTENPATVLMADLSNENDCDIDNIIQTQFIPPFTGVSGNPFLTFLFLLTGLFMILGFSIYAIKNNLLPITSIIIMFLFISLALLIATLIINQY